MLLFVNLAEVIVGSQDEKLEFSTKFLTIRVNISVKFDHLRLNFIEERA